jgi:hypothetical protein
MLSFIAQLDERRLRAVASAGRKTSPAGLALADLWRAVTVLGSGTGRDAVMVALGG